MVGILLSATKPEWSGLKKEFSFQKVSSSNSYPLYKIKNYPWYLLQTGIGRSQAETVINDFFEGFDQPIDLMIQFGLSGGLSEKVKTGDLILPEKIINQENQEVEIDQKNYFNLKNYLSATDFHQGRLLTSAEVLVDLENKQKAFSQYLAIAVDMESYPVASFCQQHQVNYFSIRACFDEVHQDLSKLDQLDLVSEQGDLKVKNFSNLILSPKMIFRLPHYQKMSSLGLNKIYQLLIKIIKEEF